MQNKSFSLPVGLSLLMAVVAVVMWAQGGSLVALMLGIGAGWGLSIGVGALSRWLGVVVPSVLALIVSLYLGVQHKGASGDSICSVSQTFDCDKVNTSEYATLFDIPIAFLGSSFYAGVIVLGLLALRGSTHKNAAHLVAVGGWVSIGYSAFLAYASAQIGAYCLFCISLYGLNGIILYSALKMAGEAGGPLLGSALGAKGAMNVFVGSAAIMLVGTMAWYGAGVDNSEIPTGDTEEDLSGLFHKPEGPLTLDGSEPAIGSSTAKYVVVEFADFECPYCGRLFPDIHALAEDPDIQVKFKHYPLSGMCNDGLSPDRHVNACGAARASDCANRQGLFWEYSKQLFKNQKDLDPEGLMIMAKLVGLDVDALAKCMDDDLTKAKVRTDIAHGEAAGVHATPSLFLKGLYGDDWVAVSSGPKGVAKLVSAHKAGKTFPATPPPPKPHKH